MVAEDWGDDWCVAVRAASRPARFDLGLEPLCGTLQVERVVASREVRDVFASYHHSQADAALVPFLPPRHRLYHRPARNHRLPPNASRGVVWRHRSLWQRRGDVQAHDFAGLFLKGQGALHIRGWLLDYSRSMLAPLSSWDHPR
eukprot:CAMPEP_0180279026 /NCGR_PEP_ID=MMETSP0988-20121125/7824_1 /TAXON_ID=697907 /ORGANISM="non described non described, Strain CCMP2293" /LENGTH=143 /DNA_ID=CAMNT_0022250667 /DNA_START=329 /DNA_END=757 /DNA_ORIENTATION=+